jgi:RNA polymerase sigma-70 factor, ECF subfamily
MPRSIDWIDIVPETNQMQGLAEHVNDVGLFSSMATAGEHHPSLRIDDARLIRAAQQGNTAAFEQLVRRYDRAILRLTVHLTGSEDDGQDVYQEAFLRAYIHLARFRFECSFYTWIYRIATNLCLDHLRRKRARGRELSITYAPDGQEQKLLERMPDESVGASPERNLSRRILREHILRALGSLSPRERMIFELKHYHGMQLRTVAGILGTTEGTVKNTLFRATHKLRLQLSALR